MNQDIDDALQGWNYKPGLVQARLIVATNGRDVLQMRVDLGILQMETVGRPDGHKPHGCASYFAYLKHQVRKAQDSGESYQLSEDDCDEADREFVQYYHRRVSWMALRRHARAVADADHTLAFMDLVREHSPNEEYVQVHERYRGFVLFHRTQSAAELASERGDPEAAIDAVRLGLEKMRKFFADFEAEDEMEEDGMVQELRQLEQNLRLRHNVGETLREQLERAVANEDYEVAAKLRDALRKKI